MSLECTEENNVLLTNKQNLSHTSQIPKKKAKKMGTADTF